MRSETDSSNHKQSDECTPLNSSSNSKASNDIINSKNIPIEYGTILKIPKNYRELNRCDLIVFFILFWNIYVTRKVLYPFTKQFSSYYGISIESFSFILSSYDIGGFLSILISCFSPFHHVRINFMVFLMMVSVFVLYLILEFSDVFITLFIIRMLFGFIFTITQSQVRGILSMFLKPTHNDNMENIENNTHNKLGFAMLSIEASWVFSTINWVLIGIILNQLNVEYVWYLMSLYTLIGAITSYFLPKSTVSDILSVKNHNKSTLNNNNNDTMSLSKQNHIFFFFIAYMLWSTAFNSYLATFGAWITIKFNLNAQELGINTMVISCGEAIAMITTAILQKYFKNITILLFAVICCILTMTVFMIILIFNIYTQTIVWIIVFIFTDFSEMSYLNLLIVNLYITPKGLETKTSLIISICSRLGTIIGVISAPHIVKIYGFTKLIQIVVAIQIVAFILIYISLCQFKRKQIKNIDNDH